MKLVCDQCGHEGPPGAMSMEGGALRLTCESCGHVALMGESATESAEAPATEAPPEQPDDGQVVCPKCYTRQAPADACVRCGLSAERWNYEDEELERFRGDPTGAAMWARVMDHFDDDEAHAALISYAGAQGPWALNAVARCYRKHEAEQPDVDSERVRGQLRRIAETAQVLFLERRDDDTREQRKSLRNVFLMLSICGIALVLLALSTWFRSALQP